VIQNKLYFFIIYYSLYHKPHLPKITKTLLMQKIILYLHFCFVTESASTAPASLFQRIRTFLTAQQNPLAAFWLSLTAGGVFLVIAFADRLYWLNQNGQEIFSVRMWSLALFTLYIFGTYLLCFLRGWKTWRAVSTWVQSNLLMLISFVFMFRLNNQALDFFGFSISTGVIFIPLTILVFIVNHTLFTGARMRMSVIAAQLFVFFVQAFSLINFLADNKVATLAFREPIIEYILNLPVFVWLAICAAAVSTVSVFNVSLPAQYTNAHRWRAWAGFFVVMLGFLMLINSLSLSSYWYKTLIMLVIWDFIFTPFQVIFEEKIDPQFQAKIRLSALYHAVLIVVIVVWYFMSINPVSV